ncbi:MAG: hypothetical protein SFW66_01450 [Gammaproteobacteria bacterium]|nr:hypothetical protein [Gammaproteobacteria bacterium]
MSKPKKARQPVQTHTKASKLLSVHVKLCHPTDPDSSEVPRFIFENGKSVHQDSGALCSLNDPNRITYGRFKQKIYENQIRTLEFELASERLKQQQLQEAALHENNIMQTNQVFLSKHSFPRQWPPSPRLPLPGETCFSAQEDDDVSSQSQEGYESEQDEISSKHEETSEDGLTDMSTNQPVQWTSAFSPVAPTFNLPTESLDDDELLSLIAPRERAPSPLVQHHLLTQDKINQEVQEKLRAILTPNADLKQEAEEKIFINEAAKYCL